MPFLGFIGKFFKKLFGKEGWLKKNAIPFAIDIVNKVKEWDSTHPEFADLLTILIPGTWDDALKLKARAALKLALDKMAVFNDCLQLENEDEKIACIITQIQSIVDLDVKALRWAELAAHITKALADDERLDINEISALIKIAYEKADEDDED